MGTRLLSFALWGAIILTALPAYAGITDMLKKGPDPLRNEMPMDEETAIYDRLQFVPPTKNKKPVPLTYFLMRPAPPYPENVQFPLVLVLHDTDGKAPAAKHLASYDMQVSFPSIVVVPALPLKRTWASPQSLTYNGKTVPHNPNEAIHDVMALVKGLVATLPVDRSRIYVMGCDEGGTGAFGASLYYPDVFAAAIAISGGWAPEDSPKMTKVPLWAIHGAKDTQMPSHLSSDMVNLVQEYGGQAFYTEISSMAHDCTTDTLYQGTTWDWLFFQTKKPVIAPAQAAPLTQEVPPEATTEPIPTDTSAENAATQAE